MDSAPALDDEYYLVDDDGNVIEPAAEGSCLMAEGLVEMARAETGEDYVIAEPYVPDFDVAAARARSKAFFEEHNARREAEASASDEAGTEGAGLQKGSTVEGAEEEEFEEEEEEEEFPAMGSRDMTDPEDWRLERIVRRRLNKEREGGLWVYLCKWAGHAEPTWETREVMEDAGWIPQLDAFDSKGEAHNKQTSAKKKRPIIKPMRHEETLAAIQSYFGGHEALLDMVRAAIGYASRGGCPMRYCNVNLALASAFFERWKRCKDTHVPTIVYHGTRAENFYSICKLGLVVGGTHGVRIAHGTAYGSGVYTASHVNTPMSYNCGCNAFIVCVGLVPIDQTHPSVYQVSNGYLIFRNPSDVLPMWLVQYAGMQRTDGPTMVGTREFVEYALRSFNSSPHLIVSSFKPSAPIQIDSDALTESENRKVDRAMAALKGSTGGIKSGVLKGQPRKIRELLARAAIERRKAN